MDDEREDIINQLRQNNDYLAQQNTQLNSLVSNTNFSPQKDSNLIQLQLDTTVLLSNIEHFLKGDVVIIDDKGNEIYTKPKDENQILLNEYGVNLIMSTIGQYIDKNTFLSFYTQERIYEILADLGDELTDVIFCNYERMGLTTEFKKSRYKLIVITIIHTIESSYRRAIGGKATEELNTSRLYTPGSMNPGSNYVNNMREKTGILGRFKW